MSPELAGRFLTTVPPGKPEKVLNVCSFPIWEKVAEPDFETPPHAVEGPGEMVPLFLPSGQIPSQDPSLKANPLLLFSSRCSWRRGF